MRHVLLLPLVLTVLLLSLAPSSPTRKQESKDEKRFTLDVKGKTWSEVFQWLSEATGKPILACCRPTGTCHVTTPPDQRFTLNEVIDLLNEDLLSKDRPTPFYLFPRDRCINLVSWEEGWEGLRPWYATIDDLDPLRFPRSVPMIVQIVLPLKTLNTTDLEPRVRKMMGPHGHVVALEGANRLLMQDQPHNLRRIVSVIRNLDKPHKP